RRPAARAAQRRGERDQAVAPASPSDRAARDGWPARSGGGHVVGIAWAATVQGWCAVEIAGC
ncbi:MAG: hypothetical protein M3462_05015, partial [Chloroflexota bacterium]|nr:hypothetical protein [Chloroflexota bacterium]